MGDWQHAAKARLIVPLSGHECSDLENFEETFFVQRHLVLVRWSEVTNSERPEKQIRNSKPMIKQNRELFIQNNVLFTLALEPSTVAVNSVKWRIWKIFNKRAQMKEMILDRRGQFLGKIKIKKKIGSSF